MIIENLKKAKKFESEKEKLNELDNDIERLNNHLDQVEVALKMKQQEEKNVFDY